VRLGPDRGKVRGTGPDGAGGSYTGNGAEPLLELRQLSKHFGAVQALSEVNLDVYPGRVTALVGDNGAGKSVTLKTIAGIHPPDGGEIRWRGKPVHIRGPRDSAALGIETVYQDLALCNNLDIVQNMFLGRERTGRGLLDENSMETAAVSTLSSLNVTTVRSVRQQVASLSGGQRQAVAVAKAVMWNSKLVIMDEPTAALGVAQTAMVLRLTRTLAERGLAVIFVSHNSTTCSRWRTTSQCSTWDVWWPRSRRLTSTAR
jgi:ABC-type sugar transport system ATPase subunit